LIYEKGTISLPSSSSTQPHNFSAGVYNYEFHYLPFFTTEFYLPYTSPYMIQEK